MNTAHKKDTFLAALNKIQKIEGELAKKDTVQEIEDYLVTKLKKMN
ncbi:MAG: hypothetical protein LBQ95_09025 [Lachnospiraceae bacterium]|jgi:NADH:ubiquinone oxidoreductase subunit E|nr:hypothetical protein [Lachnospiraceae bacterium]